MIYFNYICQGGNDDKMASLINEVEPYTNKDRNLYEILTHYYKHKDDNKFEKYMAEGRAFDKSTKGHDLDIYLLMEGKFEEYMTASEKAFEDRKLRWGFGRHVFLDEHRDDPRLKVLIEKHRKGR